MLNKINEIKINLMVLSTFSLFIYPLTSSSSLMLNAPKISYYN
jgi:hypothetical protein